MSIRPHLWEGAEPAKDGSDLVAGCGVVVPNARFVTWMDGSFDDPAAFLASLNSMNTCQLCLRLAYKKRYFGRILTGEDYIRLTASESKQRGRKAEASK